MSIQMKKMLLIVGILFGVIFGWYGFKKVMGTYFMAHYEVPPVTISATVATTKIWEPFLHSVGTLTAVNGSEISTEAPGIVKQISFKSGEFVHAGDLLVTLDTSIEQAQLKNSQAQLQLNQLNYDRNKILLKKNVIAQVVLDDSLAQLQKSAASVEEIAARIKQKTITAPFNGKIGIKQVNLGEYISAGAPIVSLEALDPLYVQFTLPEQYLQNLTLQQPIDIDTDTEKNIKGSIIAINSKVDQATHNILVQAAIPNKNLSLYPGMFALVKVWLPQQHNVVTLPQTAISYSLHGDSVFVIKAEKDKKTHKDLLHAYRQYISVGERRGDEVAIVKGIQAGDQVVISGQLKLQNGTRIIVDNSVEL